MKIPDLVVKRNELGDTNFVCSTSYPGLRHVCLNT